MATRYFQTVNGMIVAERSGPSRLGYLSDALGSVTATVQDGVVVNVYRYKPSGAILEKQGISPDPTYLWTGTTGSRTVSGSPNIQYNVRRHYSPSFEAWLTVDILWPKEAPYGYANCNPVTLTDPMGTSVSYTDCKTDSVLNCCEKYKYLDPKAVASCLISAGWGHQAQLAYDFVEYLRKRCDSDEHNTCVFCFDPSKPKPHWMPKECFDVFTQRCSGGSFAHSILGDLTYTLPVYPEPIERIKPGPRVGPRDIDRPRPCPGDLPPTQVERPCQFYLREGMACYTGVILCKRMFESADGHTSEVSQAVRCGALAHEMLHGAGYGASVEHGGDQNDIIHAMGACICAALNGGKPCPWPLDVPPYPGIL